MFALAVTADLLYAVHLFLSTRAVRTHCSNSPISQHADTLRQVQALSAFMKQSFFCVVLGSAPLELYSGRRYLSGEACVWYTCYVCYARSACSGLCLRFRRRKRLQLGPVLLAKGGAEQVSAVLQEADSGSSRCP